MQIRRLIAGAAVAVGALALLAGPVSAVEGEGGEVDIEAVLEEIHHLEEEGVVDHAVAECAILALENNDSDRCQESPNLILPATNELIWGGLAFLALLLALWKFGLPAATKMSNERTEKIRASLDEADSARVEAQTVLVEYQRQLADARSEAARIVEEARQQADQVRRDLVGRAEVEAAELRTRNAEQVAAEAGRVQGELQQQVAGLAIDLAERVVGANLDRTANLRLIEDYISSVGTAR